MSRVKANVTMSLAGFVAGPDQRAKDPLGIGGMQLHQWLLPLKAFRERHGEEVGEVKASRPVADAAGGRDVSVGGGATVVQQSLAAGLLDELVVSLVPILLGGGARPFDDLGEPKPRLRQVQAVDAPGVTPIRYRRDPDGRPGPTGEGGRE
jgi:hypothetical protein